MKLSLFFRLVFAVVALAAGAGSALAAGQNELDAAKARMTVRVGAVTGLKDRHIAGENNEGLLELRGKANAAEQKLLNEENADRRIVYAGLAAKTGTSAEIVARQRAQQLAAIARRGTWVQDASGEWKKKS